MKIPIETRSREPTHGCRVGEGEGGVIGERHCRIHCHWKTGSQWEAAAQYRELAPCLVMTWRVEWGGVAGKLKRALYMFTCSRFTSLYSKTNTTLKQLYSN